MHAVTNGLDIAKCLFQVPVLIVEATSSFGGN